MVNAYNIFVEKPKRRVIIKKWLSMIPAGNLETKGSKRGGVRRWADASYARGRSGNPTYC
jgi:hypothetical protein